MVKVLDLETTTDYRYVTEKMSETVKDDRATFICALMWAEVGETCDRIVTHYGRVKAENALLSLPPDIYYTWNGSRFDLHFIYHVLRRNGYKVQDLEQQEDNKKNRKRDLKVKEFTYLLSGSKIISLTAYTPKGKIEFKDACLLFSTNLATFIKNTCPEFPKLEGVYNYAKFRLTEDDFSPSDKEYCKADIKGFAIGLHRIQQQFYDHFNMDILESFTAGSFAMKFAKREMMRTLNIEVDEFEKLFKTRKEFPREFISGGRTYVNPERKGMIFDEVKKIDSNSAYPASMVKRKHPLGDFVKLELSHDKLKELLDKHPDVYVFAKLKLGQVFYNDKFSPIIVKKDGSCQYPIHATAEEGVYLDDYTLRDEKFHALGIFDVYLFENTTLKTPIFEYMDEVYNLKNKFKKEGKKGLELAVKIILNSTFGKFLQKDEMDVYDFMENFITKIKDEKNFIQAWFIYPALGASITASVRYELTQYMNALGSHFIYCDTDSLIYTGDTPKAINLGNELGAWKEEATPTGVTSYGENCEKSGEFIAFQAKTYAIILDGDLKLTFCGISSKAVDKEFPKGSTVLDVQRKMLEGINFDVLRSYKTVNGILLLDNTIAKSVRVHKALVEEDYTKAKAVYTEFLRYYDDKHNGKIEE